jgi:hypothetical protein
MQRHSPKTAAAAPTPDAMLRVWRADRCVQDSSAALYLQWIRRFRIYSATHGLGGMHCTAYRGLSLQLQR